MFRLWTLLFALVASTFVVAGARPNVAGGSGGGDATTTLTVLLPIDVDYTDPALDYLSTGWQLEYATCLKLVNYADDSSAPDAAVPQPEAATGLPLVSADGKTYTFTVRDGFRFSPPSNELVTAATFKHVFERIQSPTLQSPGQQFISDVTSVTADGQTLVITLSAPNADLLARLALPFFCAVPLNAPMIAMQAPASAGPYYISSRTPNVEITLDRNPNYPGNRPRNFDRIVYRIGDSLDSADLKVTSGVADYAAGGIPPASYARVDALYGPGSPAAAIGRQRFFINPQLGFSYLALNTSRPVFSNPVLRRAVGYAIDRQPLIDQGGYQAATATDQYLPPGIPGYVDQSIYPLHGDLAQAKALAASQGVTPTTPVAVVLYTSNRGSAPYIAQIVKTQLAPVGIDVTVVEMSRAEQINREGTLGEPFDITTEGWIASYNDPFNILNVLLDGRTIRATNNNNVSYFNDPTFNARLDTAAQLAGSARYIAYAQLEHDLVQAAPLVSYANFNNRDYFADRIGCQQYGTFGMNLASLCLRDSDTTPPTFGVLDDVTVDATSPAGASASFIVTATDDRDPSPDVTCTHASGSTFAIGDTLVSCTATDATGNSASARFTIHVRGASEQLVRLGAELALVGPGSSLADKVAVAESYVAQNRPVSACSVLDALAKQLRAQADKTIPIDTVQALTTEIRRVEAVLRT